MKFTIYTFLISMLFVQGARAQVENKLFQKPFRLKTGAEFINVHESGHSAPYLYDINKDGKLDLLLGYYGRERLETDTVRFGHCLTKGACKIYLNNGDNIKPEYAYHGEIQAGNDRAFVPCDCCVGFVPALADINGDGIDDLVSGSFPGQAYFFKGKEDGNFEPFVFIRDTLGNALNPGHTTTVAPFDWDGDGLLDLVWGVRFKGVAVSRNVGTRKQAAFLTPEFIDIMPYTAGHEKVSSHTVPVDWNGDGRFDLVCGSESGDVFVCLNTGTAKEPKFDSKPEVLILNKRNHSKALVGENQPNGYRSKLFVHDYNGDGKLDILLGDVYTEREIFRELTSEEMMLKKQKETAARGSKEERRAFFKPYYDFVDKESVKLMAANSDLTESEAKGLAWNNLPVEMLSGLNKYLQENKKKWAFLSDFKTQNSYLGGFVWVYIQK
ncbi:VCBS repeat-containing protein [Marinifilum fragile]|uniref:FG-GAP repeat domain-containing protein n=1 Tax=Marinifilum fragile TaxID=570161 RepID=UPI002AAA782B|nr:VCBS repeat-containing protein [Marinifilum fragile]